MAAEGPLHELGAIQITNSDSQGMGRIGETLRRTLQLAHVMKGWVADEIARRQRARPALPGQVHHRAGDHARHCRPRRLAAAGPAGRHRALEAGLAGGQAGGRVQVGLSRHGAHTARATPRVEWAEPRRLRPGWGGRGLASAASSVTFVSSAIDADAFGRRLGSRRTFLPIGNTRGSDARRPAAQPRDC